MLLDLSSQLERLFDLLAFLQSRADLIEHLAKLLELIVRRDTNLDVIIPLGQLSGGVGQMGDGHRVIARPHDRKHNGRYDHQENQDHCDLYRTYIVPEKCLLSIVRLLYDTLVGNDQDGKTSSALGRAVGPERIDAFIGGTNRAGFAIAGIVDHFSHTLRITYIDESGGSA